jgi:hypothetical protein
MFFHRQALFLVVYETPFPYLIPRLVFQTEIAHGEGAIILVPVKEHGSEHRFKRLC